MLGALLLMHASAPRAESSRLPPDAQPPVDRLAAYGGVWHKIDLDDQNRARLASIDEALSELSWLVRKMAGPVLRKSTAPPPEMDFVWDGERLHQRVDGDGGRFTRPVDLDAEPVERIDARGEPFLSRWTWTAEGLKVHWEQRQARGTNLYRVDPRDQTLRVRHTIQVTALDDVSPIVFSSRFRRAQLPSISAANPDRPPTLAGKPIER